MNWDQTNATHENKTSIYSDIGKMRYKKNNIQWIEIKQIQHMNIRYRYNIRESNDQS